MRKAVRTGLLCLVVAGFSGATAMGGDDVRDVNGCQCVLVPVYWCDSAGCTQIATRVVMVCPSSGGGASGSW